MRRRWGEIKRPGGYRTFRFHASPRAAAILDAGCIPFMRRTLRGEPVTDPLQARPVPDIVTPPPGPRARAHIEFDHAWTSPSLPRAYPIVPVRGLGCAVEDIDGNVFLDFAAGIAGAEAVEAGIKLAKYHTRRPNLIAFLGGFHGRTMGALSLTASKAKYHSHFGPLLPGVYHVPFGGEGLDELERRVFKRLIPADEFAA